VVAIGVEQAWGDGVHPHPVSAELAGQRLGEPEYSGFRRAVRAEHRLAL